MSRFVVGVDGGATKTHALIASDDGVVRGFGESGPSNIYEMPEPDAITNIVSAVNAARTEAGIGTARLACGTFSLCGADWPEDFVDLERWLAAERLADRVVVLNDAVGGLIAGVPDGPGVSVICGTATAIGARGRHGEIWHSSFWQLVGAGMDMARATLDAVYRAELGLLPETALTPAVLGYLGLASVEEVLHESTRRRGQPIAGTRTLARVLLDTAQVGDDVATNIVTRHGRDVGDFTVVAARRVGIARSAFPVVLGGSVLRHPSPLFADAIVRRIREESPEASVVRLNRDPVIGAVTHALRGIGSRSSLTFP